jgi:hypothetical protein
VLQTDTKGEMIMICTRCGTYIEDGETVCYKCGFIFEENVQQNNYNQPQPYNQQGYNQQSYGQPAYNQPHGGYNQQYDPYAQPQGGYGYNSPDKMELANFAKAAKDMLTSGILATVLMFGIGFAFSILIWIKKSKTKKFLVKLLLF